ncbi:sensor histidine kinase [Endothiovibrio diazotrophicus]
MTIRTKLLLVILPPSLAALLLLGGLAFLTARQGITGEVLQHLESVASIQGHRLGAIVDRNLERLQLVASRTQLRLSLRSYNQADSVESRALLQARMTRIIADARASIADFRTISIYGRDGRVAASTDPQRVGRDRGDDPPVVEGFARASADRLFRAADGSVGVRLSGPLQLDGETIGGVVIEAATTTLVAALHDYSGLGGSGESLLLRRAASGDVLYLAPSRFDPDAALRRVAATAGDDVARMALAGRSEQLEEATDYRGRLVLAAVQPVAGTDWGLVVKIDHDEAFAPVHHLATWLVAGGGLALLALALAAIHFARTLSRPLAELTVTTRRISEGDLTIRLPSLGDDEIGILAARFNGMTARLAESDQALRRTIGEMELEIAQRKRAEERLQRYTERLQRSNRELEEFAYVASHDLQEPLRKVRAFGERLQSRFGAQLGEQGQDYLGRMVRASERLQNLINDLLLYSRVSTRAKPFEAVELAALAAEVLAELGEEREGLELQGDIGELPVVRADPSQMRQLLQNLIANAIKFRRPEVPLELRIRGGVRAEGEAGEQVWLCVADNGIGFEPQYGEQIFQVFQRLHGRAEYEGSGVGLAICQKIVARHGGIITAEGRPGLGATFTATWPLHPPEGEIE